EPLAAVDARRALQLAAESKVPMLNLMVRRIGSAGTPEALAGLVDFISETDDSGKQLIVLDGINQALRGRKQVEMPAKWKNAYSKLMASNDSNIRNQALTLAVTFGDRSAFEQLRALLVTK